MEQVLANSQVMKVTPPPKMEKKKKRAILNSVTGTLERQTLTPEALEREKDRAISNNRAVLEYHRLCLLINEEKMGNGTLLLSTAQTIEREEIFNRFLTIMSAQERTRVSLFENGRSIVKASGMELGKLKLARRRLIAEMNRHRNALKAVRTEVEQFDANAAAVPLRQQRAAATVGASRTTKTLATEADTDYVSESEEEDDEEYVADRTQSDDDFIDEMGEEGEEEDDMDYEEEVLEEEAKANKPEKTVTLNRLMYMRSKNGFLGYI